MYLTDRFYWVERSEVLILRKHLGEQTEEEFKSKIEESIWARADDLLIHKFDTLRFKRKPELISIMMSNAVSIAKNNTSNIIEIFEKEDESIVDV